MNNLLQDQKEEQLINDIVSEINQFMNQSDYNSLKDIEKNVKKLIDSRLQVQVEKQYYRQKVDKHKDNEFTRFLQKCKFSMIYLIYIYLKQTLEDNDIDKNQIYFQLLSKVQENVFENDYQNRLNYKQYKKIEKDLQLILYVFTNIPSIYIEFLQNDLFEELENYDMITPELDLKIIREALKYKIFYFIKVNCEDCDLYFNDVDNELYELITVINQRISILFEQNKEVIKDNVEQFKIQTQNLKIGLLKDLSRLCYNDIRYRLQLTFLRQIDPDKIEIFIHYLIEKHDYFKIYDSNQINVISNNYLNLFLTRKEIDIKEHNKHRESQQEEMNIQNMGYKKQMNIEDIHQTIEQISNEESKVKLAFNENSDAKGYLIINQNTSYLIHYRNDRLYVLNSVFLSKNWKLQNKEPIQQSVMFDQLGEMVSNKNLAHSITNNFSQPPPITTTAKTNMLLAGGIANAGASLGFCLANINNYKNSKDFAQDFGKIAALNGAISSVVLLLPVLGTLILIGGLGYTTFKVMSDSDINLKNKLKQGYKLGIGSATGVGGTLSGAVLGQMMIPVPFVGAFVGGFMGGLIGGITGSKILTNLNNKQFGNKIYKIQTLITREGYWIFDDQMIRIYGFKEQYFLESIPGYLQIYSNKENIWVTMINYFLLSIYFQNIQQKKQKEIENSKKQFLFFQKNSQQQIQEKIEQLEDEA